MGGELKKYFNTSYKSIGFFVGTGTYTAVGWKGLSAYDLYIPQKETYEYLFSKLNCPMFFLKNDKLLCSNSELSVICTPMFYREIGANASIYQYTCGNIFDLFDGIIYINNTSASKCFLLE